MYGYHYVVELLTVIKLIPSDVVKAKGLITATFTHDTHPRTHTCVCVSTYILSAPATLFSTTFIDIETILPNYRFKAIFPRYIFSNFSESASTLITRQQFLVHFQEGRKEENVLFSDAHNTFYLGLYGIRPLR